MPAPAAPHPPPQHTPTTRRRQPGATRVPCATSLASPRGWFTSPRAAPTAAHLPCPAPLLALRFRRLVLRRGLGRRGRNGDRRPGITRTGERRAHGNTEHRRRTGRVPAPFPRTRRRRRRRALGGKPATHTRIVDIDETVLILT